MLQVASAPEYHNQDHLPHSKLSDVGWKKYEIKKRIKKGADIQDLCGFSFSAKKNQNNPVNGGPSLEMIVYTNG